MVEMDLNEQFIVYVIYKGCGKWYISDKEIWYLDYQKRNYYRCIEVTNRNHTLEASNSKFEKIVSRAIKEFGVV